MARHAMTRLQKFFGYLCSSNVVYPLVLLVVILAAWETMSDQGLLPPYLVPSPSVIAARLWKTKYLLWPHALITSYEIMVGFALSVIGGVFLGAAVISSKVAQKAAYPWLVVVQVVPKVAIGPLIIIWLGFGFWPKVLIAFLLGFFPIMISTMHGLASVERDQIFMLQTMGGGSFSVFRYLLLYSSLPDICNSFKVAITLVTIGAIVGEFIGSDTGLGYVLISANGSLDAPLLFVALLWITVISLIFYAAVSLIEKFMIPWHVSVRAPTVATRV